VLEIVEVPVARKTYRNMIHLLSIRDAGNEFGKTSRMCAGARANSLPSLRLEKGCKMPMDVCASHGEGYHLDF